MLATQITHLEAGKMQKMMGLMRKCIDDYHMISPGDKIAVGVSGGKDSLTLLTVLAALRSYYPAPFELAAITIDMGLDGMDFSPVEQYCKELNVGYFCKKTEIGPIIFDYRKEKNPDYNRKPKLPVNRPESSYERENKAYSGKKRLRAIRSA